MNGNNRNVNVCIIYDPNEFNNLNLNVSYNGNGSKNNSDAWSYNSSNSLVNSISRTLSNAKTNNDGLTSSLFYKHKFDKKTQHGYEVEINYFNSLNNTSSTDYQNINYNIDTAEIYRSAWLNEKSKTNTQTFTGQTNYTLPFDSVYSFNIGASTNFNKYSIDNTSSLL